MPTPTARPNESRRALLKGLCAATIAGVAPTNLFAVNPQAESLARWRGQIGFALFTVRDLLAVDPDRTMAAIAAMGIKEVQPRTYLGLAPKPFRALLDRHGLTCHSTHEFSVPGPDLPRELAAFAEIGIKYVRFPLPGEAIPGTAPGRGGNEGGGTQATGRGGTTGRGGAAASGRGAPTGRGANASAAQMAETPDMMRRVAADLNRNGAIAAKFGMKALYHNHTTEFQRYPGEPLLPYEILLKETDPKVVAMEVDLGWASIAGCDVVRMFQEHPGRFELWHIKDALGLRHLTPAMNQLERRANVYLTPVGQGEVDYRQYFAHATTAGLKHYYIEQDNANAWGDSMAATRVSVEALKRLLA